MIGPSYLRAVQAAYDTVAADYAVLVSPVFVDQPIDRAMLGAFAELVLADGARPVADLGCGPGRVTAHLHSLGLNTFGVDLSPEMIAVARRMHPDLRFEEGSITALDLADCELGGVVAWYSIIHIPPPSLPAVFAEFHRVLAPGGHLLLAFQVGENEPRHIEQAYGHEISLDAYRLSPGLVTESLNRAGFLPSAELVREPVGAYEKTCQAYILARKAVTSQDPEGRREDGQ